MLYVIDRRCGPDPIAEAREATSFFARLIGWMGRKHAADGEGLLLRRCGWIHTCFMRFPIDVLYLDSYDRVVAIHPAVRPWRITPRHPRAQTTLELHAHAAGAVQLGDSLSFSKEAHCTK